MVRPSVDDDVGAGESVVLVDRDDAALGTLPKLQAHREGRLHRAMSVLLVDPAGRILLQRRAAHKYHSAGLWANSCCGHPRAEEAPMDAARRRLYEEMGLDCVLEPAGLLYYRAPLAGGLIEHEVDHVFVGRCDRAPRPDPREVDEWRWSDTGDVLREIAREPSAFAVWLRPVLATVANWGPASPMTLDGERGGAWCQLRRSEVDAALLRAPRV